MSRRSEEDLSRGFLIRWFWRSYARFGLWIMLLAFLFMAVEGGALGILSYMVKPMFDDVFVGGDPAAVYRVALIVFAIFIARAFAGFAQRVLMTIAGRKIALNIQKDMAMHLMSLDSDFFQRNAPGALIDRVRGDTSGAVGVISKMLSAVGRDGVALISLIGVALSIDWVWTLIALAGGPLVFLPVTMLQRMIRNNSRRIRRAVSNLYTRLDELFHGINTIKLNGTEEHYRARYERALANSVARVTRVASAQAGIPAMMDIVAAIGFLGVLSYGGMQIIAGTKTIGEFMSFFTAIALVFEPLRRLGSMSGTWQSALVNIERIYAVFDEKPTILSPAEPRTLPMPAGEADIVLQDVRLAYGENAVLDGLSFTAKAGQTTALVGASGAGKSTVFNVLARIVDVDAGRVTLGGVDIHQLDLKTLRGFYSVVTQDAQMFDETVQDNILLGRAVDEATLNAALDAANVSVFLPDLEAGLETQVGPRGSRLSGGQRQRVAIARAVIRNTPVLLLDEATSALDAHSEAAVQEALEKLSAGRTTLVIAHRLATVRNADKIVVMDRGRVVDEGTHDELIGRDGIYAGLYRLQFNIGGPAAGESRDDVPPDYDGSEEARFRDEDDPLA